VASAELRKAPVFKQKRSAAGAAGIGGLNNLEGAEWPAQLRCRF